MRRERGQRMARVDGNHAVQQIRKEDGGEQVEVKKPAEKENENQLCRRDLCRLDV